MAVLQTLKLTLSPCRPGDCADFMELERDPEVMRFLNGGQAHRSCNRATPTPRFSCPGEPNPTFGPRAAPPTARSSGGSACRRRARQAARARICLCRMEWGQGLATEGASALIKWGFSFGGYDKIFAGAMTVNHASRRVLEKIGLNYVRTVQVDWPDRFPGIEDGEVQYEVMRSEWNGG